MEIHKKFVEFDKWCEKCKNYKKSPTDDPCNECLTHPVNDGSRKPVCFENAIRDQTWQNMECD